MISPGFLRLMSIFGAMRSITSTSIPSKSWLSYRLSIARARSLAFMRASTSDVVDLVLRILQTRQDCAHVLDDFVGREWLAQKASDAGVHHSFEPVRRYESSTKHDWNVVADLPQPLECLFAIHEWHRQIEQNQLKRV